MEKKKILMVCEAFGGGVFTYVSQLCNVFVKRHLAHLSIIRRQTQSST